MSENNKNKKLFLYIVIFLGVLLFSYFIFTRKESFLGCKGCKEGFRRIPLQKWEIPTGADNEIHSGQLTHSPEGEYLNRCPDAGNYAKLPCPDCDECSSGGKCSGCTNRCSTKEPCLRQNGYKYPLFPSKEKHIHNSPKFINSLEFHNSGESNHKLGGKEDIQKNGNFRTFVPNADRNPFENKYDKSYDEFRDDKKCSKHSKYHVHFSEEDSCKHNAIRPTLTDIGELENVQRLNAKNCNDCFPKDPDYPNIVQDYDDTQDVCIYGDVSLRKNIDMKHVSLENNSNEKVYVAIDTYRIVEREEDIPEPMFYLNGGEFKDIGVNSPGCPAQYIWLYSFEDYEKYGIKKVINRPHIIPWHGNDLIINKGMNKWFITDFARGASTPR